MSEPPSHRHKGKRKLKKRGDTTRKKELDGQIVRHHIRTAWDTTEGETVNTVDSMNQRGEATGIQKKEG